MDLYFGEKRENLKTTCKFSSGLLQKSVFLLNGLIPVYENFRLENSFLNKTVWLQTVSLRVS